MENFNRIIFWLKAARVHTMPMSFMSWLVVFCWSYSIGGDFFYGILALIGIMSAHMGVNLVDDYFDYKEELKEQKFQNDPQSITMQKGKCKYMIEGKATLEQTFRALSVFFAIAIFIGIFLAFKCGWQVLLIAFVASLFCAFYPFLTYRGLGEIAVGMTFAPLLFMGTSFVMLGGFSSDILLLSISTGLLTVGLLHTHALMDYDFDVKNNKKTLCTLLKSKEKALVALGIMMAGAYLNIILGIFTNKFPASTAITLISAPLAVVLYKSMSLTIQDPNTSLPKKFWMGPMEHWEEIKANNAHNFMLNFYLSRNIMMFFTILLCISLLTGY
ncbi:MAG TPA: prenyltransferase [Candidatus Gastranaerophilaceae bacterium]|mgnify:CR=1 FL=1|nr:prenyltransferase [Candidatus Gastranaerophilaceae bacterium]HPT40758.1 prenyltransferase [Candidatus Gastranaerophilaceae bacterium]